MQFPQIISHENIVIIGDIHGEFGLLNNFLNKKREFKTIISVGDFGYWPNMKAISKNKKYPKKEIIPKLQNGYKLFFCDGNHEDHWSLLNRTTDELYPNCFYMPRGSILKLDNNFNILFMGGAESHDKITRQLGVDWFPEESISYKDISNLPDCDVDMVIAHTAPSTFITPKDYGTKETSREALNYVLEKYRPSIWYNGHYHYYHTEYIRGTRWTILNKIRPVTPGPWFEVLKF